MLHLVEPTRSDGSLDRSAGYRTRLLQSGFLWAALLLVPTQLTQAQSPPKPADSAANQEKATEPSADEKTSDESTKPPRQLEVADAATWESVADFSLSKDAKWYATFIRPTEGDGEIVVKLVDGDKAYKYPAGSSSTPVVFSHDGKWAAFIKRAMEKEAKAAQKAKKPVPSEVILIDLENDKVTTIPDGNQIQFGGEASQWLAIRKARPSTQPGGDDGWAGTDLVLHELATGKQLSFGNVSEFEFNKSGSLLAMLIDAQGKLGNGLQLFSCETKTIAVLESEAAKFKRMGWHREKDALALLKETKSDKYEKELHELIAYKNVGSPDRLRVHLDVAKDPGVAEDLTISPNRSPEWTENLDALIYGVHDAEKKEEKEEAKAAGGDDEKDAGLVIWHYQDDRLQSQQQVQEGSDKRFSFLCVYRVDEGKSIQVANEEMRNASTQRPHRFAIVTDDDEYELAGSLDGRRYQDVYVVDLKTGKRRLALKKHRWAFGMSPTGEHMLYYLGGHFFAYDMVTGESVNLTENVPTSFIDTEDDHNVEQPPIRPRGWTQDGRFVLLSDNWDVWQVPVSGGAEGVNLTVNGKEEQLRYGTIYSFDPDNPGVDLSGDAYISIYGEWTKKSGFGLIKSGQPGVEQLIWEDASYSWLNKLEDSDHYFFMRQTPSESPSYFLVGPDLKEPKQLTKINDQQKNFLWTDGVRLVDYESTNGVRLQASLMLPANYIEGKSYPTVVYIYEKLSQGANSYNSPRASGFSPAIYTSQGYAVLMPDIVYRVNDPGMSSVECVIPALDAAIATGIVDGEHVGLHGHSWGGYQTSFLITQTDKFKAAVAGAPLTNLISMYSSIYWNSGSANQPIFESSQGRFTGGYWTNIEAYTRNSPVYYAEQVTTPLLLLHNDKDGAVDWNQGIEYFNTLRRLDKPVVMLQYKGENHGLGIDENRKDYSYRMLDFFNHYLKGKDAPKWWSEGIDHLKMEEHIRDYRKAKTSKK